MLSSVTGEAVEKLIAIMRGKDVREARLAAEALLDRHLGKPRASVDVTATRLTAMPEGFVGGVASVLERALAEAEASEKAEADGVAGNLTSAGSEGASASENADHPQAYRALPARLPPGEGGSP